jgi:hypothetical protein
MRLLLGQYWEPESLDGDFRVPFPSRFPLYHHPPFAISPLLSPYWLSARAKLLSFTTIPSWRAWPTRRALPSQCFKLYLIYWLSISTHTFFIVRQCVLTDFPHKPIHCLSERVLLPFHSHGLYTCLFQTQGSLLTGPSRLYEGKRSNYNSTAKG